MEKVEPTYYVKKQTGEITGPFSGSTLQNLAAVGKIQPADHVSQDGAKWIPAANVRGLFRVEKQLAAKIPRRRHERPLTKEELIQQFLRRFLYKDDRFKDALYLWRVFRLVLAELTLPRKYVAAEIAGEKATYIEVDLSAGTQRSISADDFHARIGEGIKQVDWFKVFCIVAGAIWAAATFRAADIVWSVIFGAVVGLATMFAWIVKARSTKRYVSYEIDEAALAKMAHLDAAIRNLRKGPQNLWYVAGRAAVKRRYHAGNEFELDTRSVVGFRKSIPGVTLNTRIGGLAFGEWALYFLPDCVCTYNGGTPAFVDYIRVGVEVSYVDYAMVNHPVSPDCTVVAERWKHANNDGSRDRRFKDNAVIPVVRLGLLTITAREIDEQFQFAASKESIPSEVAMDFRKFGCAAGG